MGWQRTRAVQGRDVARHLSLRTASAVLFAVLAVTLGCQEPVAGESRAAGGRDLLISSVLAPATVAGKIERVARIDQHGYRARIRVERSLRGPFKEGDIVEVAWEELAKGRQPRFSDGERVLAILAALPTTSLWMNRFPPPLRNDRSFAVAAQGDAFLREPDSPTLQGLERWLRLSPDEREGTAGYEVLAALIATAAMPLAGEALNQIDDVNRVNSEITRSLGACLRDTKRPEGLRRDLLRRIGELRLEGMKNVVAELASTESPLQVDAMATQAILDGGIRSDQVLELLKSNDPRKRALGVRYAEGITVEDRLPQMMTSDPDPNVRATAVEQILERRGAAAVSQCLGTLGDRDVTVRERVATALARVGPGIVPAVEQIAMGSGSEQSEGAVLTLEKLGSAGVESLRRISSQHPEKRIRMLAELSLGRLPFKH